MCLQCWMVLKSVMAQILWLVETDTKPWLNQMSCKYDGFVPYI